MLYSQAVRTTRYHFQFAHPLTIISIALATFIDASLALIPVTIFWSLKSNPNERIQICIIFGINIVTSICAGIKTSHLLVLADSHGDITWASYGVWVWTTVELFLMIVCGTIPPMYPLLKRWAKKIVSMGSRIRNYPNGSNRRMEEARGVKRIDISVLSCQRGETRTIIECGDGFSRLASLDKLANDGVRVEVAYDVRRSICPPDY